MRLRRRTNKEKPEVAAFWVQAEREGTAAALSEYVLLDRAHVGFDPYELPWYAPCLFCETLVRADRLDLVREHLLVCPDFTPRHLRLVASADRSIRSKGTSGRASSGSNETAHTPSRRCA
jgi:hypothetical protein